MPVRTVRASAIQTTAVLLSRGTIEIRSLASDLRRSALDEHAPAGEQLADAAGRIRMIADILHGFPLLPTRPRLLGRERCARQELVWRWGCSPPDAREWIVSTLAGEGPRFEGYPEFLEREHQRWLARHLRRRPPDDEP